MALIKEFREFAVRGNVVDMGVGIVIGAAFTSIVNSLVKDVLTPLLALFTTGVNFGNWFLTISKGNNGGPYASLAEAQADGAITMNIGLFINATISFLVVSVVLFFVIRTINRIRRPKEVPAKPVTTKECPHCCSSIPLKAVRCPFCTSQIGE